MELGAYRPSKRRRVGEWMLDPNAKGYQNRQEAQEALSEVLAHRLWADLRRGWRYTNPNLEEVGLVTAHFPGLDDLIGDDEEFAGNPRLASATPDQRRHLFEILFDQMRQGLAVATDALDRGKVKQSAEVSRNRLRLPWATLHQKSGSKSDLKEFRRAVRVLAEGDHLPDYQVHFDDVTDKIRFTNRGVPSRDNAEPWQGHMLPDVLHQARQHAPGWDMYYLEGEWRQWLGQKGIVPRSPEKNFIKFCQSWFAKRGRP